MNDQGLSTTTMGIYVHIPCNYHCLQSGKDKSVQWPFGRRDVAKSVYYVAMTESIMLLIVKPSKNYCSFMFLTVGLSVKRSIDLFLFSYLAGGANIRDLRTFVSANIILSKRKDKLRFIRNKTKILPTEPLRLLSQLFQRFSLYWISGEAYRSLAKGCFRGS